MDVRRRQREKNALDLVSRNVLFNEMNSSVWQRELICGRCCCCSLVLMRLDLFVAVFSFLHPIRCGCENLWLSLAKKPHCRVVHQISVPSLEKSIKFLIKHSGEQCSLVPLIASLCCWCAY